MKISTYLKRKNMSQRQFAELLGLSHNAIYLYLKGKNKPSEKVLTRMKRLMNTKEVECQ